MNRREEQLLYDILTQPTAPFREQKVAAVVAQWLARFGVPFCRDSIGNIVVGADSLSAYHRLLRRRTSEPVRCFVAHMDHPGFHGVRWIGENRVQVKWHGGSPVKHLNGAKVWVAGHEGEQGVGRLHKPVLARHGRALERAEVQLLFAFEGARPAARSLYGGWMFRRPFWRAGKRLYTRVADDLIGVFAITATAIRLWRQHSDAVRPFVGLLTRAEEVGFIGAIGHFEHHLPPAVRDRVVIVSLEASRTLPGAQIGKGPVVRLGDRRTVFDKTALQVLTAVAEKVLPGEHQRRIMDGGACEGCAATAFGLPVMALSVPLGNYHNQGFEGGQDCAHKDGPAPEFVHFDDVERLVKLCEKIVTMRNLWQDPWATTRRRLLTLYKGYRKRL